MNNFIKIYISIASFFYIFMMKSSKFFQQLLKLGLNWSYIFDRLYGWFSHELNQQIVLIVLLDQWS